MHLGVARKGGVGDATTAGGKLNILNKKIVLWEFDVSELNERKFGKYDFFLKHTIPFVGDQFDFLPQASKNLATPLIMALPIGIICIGFKIYYM